MITVYMGGRQSGKTTSLIKESARTRAVIAVPTHHMAMYVQYIAGELGLDIPAPVTYDKLFQNCKTDRSTRYLVDEVQALLHHMNVDALTMNVRNGVPEDVDVQSLKNGKMETSNKELLSCFSWYANKVSESVVYANWNDGFARSEVHQHTMNFLSALRRLIDLTKLTREEAVDLAFRKLETRGDLYLIPLYLLPLIPVGTVLTSIDGRRVVYDGSNINTGDILYGCLAYGIHIPETKEEARRDEKKVIFSDAEIRCPLPEEQKDFEKALAEFERGDD